MEWLLPVVDFDLEPGASFTFKAAPQPGWDGIVNCRLLEIEPLRKLSWTWCGGDIDTVVTFTLTPSASGTALSLAQSGFKPHQKQNFGGARYGWRLMGGKLVDLLARMRALTESERPWRQTVNLLLWVLQIFLALHTVMGAVWKYANSEQTVPSLSAIPHPLWLGLGVIELFCSLGLLLVALQGSLGILVPIAAACIAAEMLLFCGIHLASGDKSRGPMIYWLVVATLCAFIAYGRLVLSPF